MPKLYELTNEYLGFWDSLNDPEADWDAAEEKLKGIEAALDSKVENCARAIRGMESDAESIAVEIERLARRKRALENKTESLRGYVQGEMMAAGRDKVQTDLFTVALQKSPAKLIVHAPTRAEAIRKMQAALCEMVIEGVEHTGWMQSDLIAERGFEDGTYTTDYLSGR